MRTRPEALDLSGGRYHSLMMQITDLSAFEFFVTTTGAVLAGGTLSALMIYAAVRSSRINAEEADKNPEIVPWSVIIGMLVPLGVLVAALLIVKP